MNYYQILEINEDASQEVIKAVYKALAKKYHPDCTAKDVKSAEKTMAQINEAYEVLSDERKRSEYDRRLAYQKSKEEKKTGEQFYNESTQSNPNESATMDNSTTEEDKAFDNIINQENLGPVGRFFVGLGKHIVNSLQENSKEINNAFIDGINMDEYTLVRHFKQAKGNKRVGYVYAMEEKGLLRKNAKGVYEPTCLLKLYW